MPVLCKIQIPKGKSKEQIMKAFEEVNDAICRSLEVDPKGVRVTILERELDRYSVGGVLMSEKKDPFGEE